MQSVEKDQGSTWGVTFSKSDTILAFKEPFFLKNDLNQARELIIRNCWTKFMIRKLAISQFSIVRNLNLLENLSRKILIKDYLYYLLYYCYVFA